MRCKVCGTEYREGSLYCGTCGVRLAEENDQDQIHKYCQDFFADTMCSIILFHVLRLLFSGEPFDQPLRSADHKK